MKPLIEIFVGAPIEIESERSFLTRLCADLEAAGQSALILGNLLLPPRKPIQQIDFLLVLNDLVCHVELKCLTGRVTGTTNGRWSLWRPDGSAAPFYDKNPYRQALDCKFAISDEMHAFADRHSSVPRPPTGSKFYSQIESFVCVFPDLVIGSNVPDDRKVRVRGYPKFVEFIGTTVRSPGWSRDDWRNFAIDLGLVRNGEFDAPTRGTESASAEHVRGYMRRFRDFHRNVPELVATTIEIGGSESKSDSCLQLVRNGQHAQLVGRSGAGKSHHAVHIAIAAAENGELPILARGADYTGKLSRLLDSSVAHVCACAGLQIVNAAKQCSVPVILIVDGFNECQGSQKQNLIKDLQAFYLRFHVPILITTQEPLSLPEHLTGGVISFRDPTQVERRALLEGYASDALPNNVDDLCKPFCTPFELSIAASCLSEIVGTPNRTALFEAYVRRRCGDRVDVALTRRVLSEIAHEMRAGFHSALPVADVWRIGERLIDGCAAPLTALQRIMSCDLLDIARGKCSFRHEMLRRFFEAVALHRAAEDPPALMNALKEPANAELLEFVFGMLSDKDAIRSCLGVASIGGHAGALVSQCLSGRFGIAGQSAVKTDIRRVLRSAGDDLESLSFRIQTGDRGDGLEVSGGREWTAYERSLLSCVANGLAEGVFFDEAFHLVGITERRVHSCLEGRLKRDALLKDSVKSWVFWESFVLGAGVRRLPGAMIVRGSDGLGWSRTESDISDKICGLVSEFWGLMPAQLYLLLDLIDPYVPKIDSKVVPLVRHCWESGIYHLQLKVMDCVRRWRWREPGIKALSESVDADLIDLLSQMRTTNPMLSSVLLETLTAFDVFPPPVDFGTAAAELREILTQPVDAESQQSAYAAISMSFEDVFQNVYYEAIETLPSSERRTLFTMAALAVPEYSIHGNYILRELAEYDDGEVLVAFRRFATELESEPLCPQETAACFLHGHIGCSRYLDAPPTLADLSNSDRKAWQAFGEIIFWLSRPHLDMSAVVERCRPIWNTIRTELAFHAVDPLFQFANCCWEGHGSNPESHPVQRLIRQFESETRDVLEFGLRHFPRLSGMDKRDRSAGTSRQWVTFIIHTLGQIGTDDTVALLEPFLSDEYHGRDAVEAIRRLRGGERNAELTFKRRFESTGAESGGGD